MAKENILIVDDEEDVLELLRYNLSKESYGIETASSGEEALTKAQAKPPDLIVLDLMLPGVDGLEVCRKLKNEDKTEKVPIVMLTAKGEESDIVTGLELGADDYVTKPFSPKVLIARIRDFTGSKTYGAILSRTFLMNSRLRSPPSRALLRRCSKERSMNPEKLEASWKLSRGIRTV